MNAQLYWLGLLLALVAGVIAWPQLATKEILGRTDVEGNFSVPFGRGQTVTGKLVDHTGKSLANQQFTLIPLEEGANIVGFKLIVWGYGWTTASFTLSSLGFLLGNVQVSNEFPWSPDRPLTWDDFQGTPPEGPLEGAVAEIAMALGYSWEYTVQLDTQTRKWTVHIQAVSTRNVMNRSRSWVIRERATDAHLQHEQKHFDLNEVYRRILQRELEKLVGTTLEGDTKAEVEERAKRQIEVIFEKVKRKVDEVQAQYDQDTAHGRNIERQREWNERIRWWLADPSRAPQP